VFRPGHATFRPCVQLKYYKFVSIKSRVKQIHERMIGYVVGCMEGRMRDPFILDLFYNYFLNCLCFVAWNERMICVL
jgi:hypothetical protein